MSGFLYLSIQDVHIFKANLLLEMNGLWRINGDVRRNMTQGFIGRLSTNKSAALGAYPSIGKAVPAHSKSLSTWIQYAIFDREA